jgi:tight adherence protein C
MSTPLMIMAVVLVALGVLAWGLLLLAQQWRRTQGLRAIDRVMHRSAPEPARTATAGEAAQALWTTSVREDGTAMRWLDSRMGRLLVVDEDRRLIEQCGFPSLRAQLVFLTSRVALAVLLPALYYALVPGKAQFVYAATLFAAGVLVPKWFLRSFAARRIRQVARELPLLVDLVGLLQGVGLGLDQTMQVIAHDFRAVLKILSKELDIANRLYSQGRTREQSLQRLSQLHDNAHLGNLVALLVQVDRHGGAVQEPLRQFSERLRDTRKSEMKAQIGKITVKMTVVMVTTLLPALILVTAGPGFMAIIRSLGAMAR